jgi:hypothetical protein
MTVLLITALRAAETLAAFHRQRIENATVGDRVHHMGVARWCAEDADRITREILAAGLTVEDQATEMRRRDLEKAHRIIDRHPIMQGMGMPLEDVAQARVEMARDIADALSAERGAASST